MTTLSNPGTIGYDTHRIVPRGAMAAMVKPLDLQIRTLVEYDVRYMQDRVRADLFANGQPLGVYAVAASCDDLDPQGLLSRFAPELERMVIEEMLGHRRHQALKAEILALRDYIERDRWFHFRPVRRRYTEARNRLRAAWNDLRAHATDYNHADL